MPIGVRSRDVLGQVLTLALPSRCVHCAEPVAKDTASTRTPAPLANYLCEVCLRVLGAGSPIASDELHSRFQRRFSEITFEHIVARFRFIESAPIRSLIHSAKYAGMMRLARELGGMLHDELDGLDYDAIVPVPLHRARLAERGYNQAQELAMGLSGEVMIRSTRRVRPTQSQTGLHIEERIENVRGAFALTRSAKSLAGKHVLIVDDVMTTGATITSVAETVMAAGPRAISIATLAVTELAEEPLEREEVRPNEADFF